MRGMMTGVANKFKPGPTPGPFDPNSVPNILLSVDGDSGYTDKSTFGNNFANVGTTISTSVLNGHDVFDLNGSGQYMTMDSIDHIDFDFFMVMKPDSPITSSSPAQGLFGSGTTGVGNGAIALGAWTVTVSDEILMVWRNEATFVTTYTKTNIPAAWILIEVKQSGGVCTISYDGVVITKFETAGGIGDQAGDRLNTISLIGTGVVASTHFAGQIAEILMYTDEVSVDNRALIEDYLNEKYDL